MRHKYILQYILWKNIIIIFVFQENSYMHSAVIRHEMCEKWKYLTYFKGICGC